MLVWVVGAGGMLGSAVCAAAEHVPAYVFSASSVPWADPAEAARTLECDARRFCDQADAGPWAIVWAAGSSVVASSKDQAEEELRTFAALLDAVTTHLPTGPGTFFLTSSAGGVFAGSSAPPFDVDTEPRPISPYGDLKLRQERLASAHLQGRLPLVIGRFSNLYGPRSNPGKGQGLIPLLCRAAVRRAPLNLYVSMDTVRDYLYVTDAAAMTWAAVRDAIAEQPTEPRLAIMASGRASTVAEVVATVQNVAHRRVPLALGTDPSAQHQATDLRLVPSVPAVELTALPNGVKRVFDAIVGRVQ